MGFFVKDFLAALLARGLFSFKGSSRARVQVVDPRLDPLLSIFLFTSCLNSYTICKFIPDMYFSVHAVPNHFVACPIKLMPIGSRQ